MRGSQRVLMPERALVMVLEGTRVLARVSLEETASTVEHLRLEE